MNPTFLLLISLFALIVDSFLMVVAFIHERYLEAIFWAILILTIFVQIK